MAIIVQAPRSHVLRRAMVYADNNVAVPRPGMILIKLAGPRGMIRMRMVPADDFQSLRLCGFVGLEHVFRGDDKAVAGRFAMTVYQREQGEHLARGVRMHSVSIAPQQGAAALVGISFRAMSANFLREMTTDPECGFLRHFSLHPRNVRSSTWTQNRRKP